MIHRSLEDGVEVVRIEHGKVGALDLELSQELGAAAHALSAGEGPVVLTGTGRAFSAGVDLPRVLREGDGYLGRFLDALDATFEAWATLPRPVVAAVNGHAIAGGCVLVAACDRRVMAKGSGRVGAPELLVGVPFPAWALALLENALAPSVARELFLRGDSYGPQESAARGLVDRTCAADELLAVALAEAHDLARIPPATFALHKQQTLDRVVRRVRELASIESDVRARWRDPATHRAIRLFLERTLGKG